MRYLVPLVLSVGILWAQELVSLSNGEIEEVIDKATGKFAIGDMSMRPVAARMIPPTLTFALKLIAKYSQMNLANPTNNVSVGFLQFLGIEIGDNDNPAVLIPKETLQGIEKRFILSQMPHTEHYLAITVKHKLVFMAGSSYRG